MERLHAGVRPRQPDHLMSRVEEFPDDGGADETGRAREEDTHSKAPCGIVPFTLFGDHMKANTRLCSSLDWRRLLAQHPELFVDLVVRDRLGDLVRDGFDVAVRVGHAKPSALKARLLLRTRIVTCASPAYIAAHGRPRRPKDVETHPCLLMRDPSTGTHFGWEFVRNRKAVGVNVTGPLMVNQFGPMLAACLAGQGIAQVLELHAREFLADGRLVQVLPEWADETSPLYAYHHAAPVMSAKVRAFLDFVLVAAQGVAPRTSAAAANRRPSSKMDEAVLLHDASRRTAIGAVERQLFATVPSPIKDAK